MESRLTQISTRTAVGVGAAILILIVAWGSGLFGARSTDGRPIVLQGNVDVRQVNLGFRVAGRIAEMTADEGDAVEPGKVVARLDTSYLVDDAKLARARVAAQKAILARLTNGTRPEEIAQARAVVAEREAALLLARATLGRQEDLAGKGFAAHQKHDEATSSMERAQAALEAARQTLRLAELGPRQEEIDAARAQLEAETAALSLAERRLADAELAAPSLGVVLTRVREPGAIVAAGETVFAVTITTPVWVRTYVTEPDLGRIRPGAIVEVKTDGGRSYSGQIGFISPAAEFTPKSVETRELRTSLVYRVRVVVSGDTSGLLQGMPVTVNTSVKR